MKKKLNIPHILITCLAAAVVLVATGSLIVFMTSRNKPEEETAKPVEEKPVQDVVSFVAVGDNMIHEKVFTYAKTENSYDFKPCYQYVQPYIQQADLAYINQETMTSGDEFGIKGYPAFNSPVALIQDLKDIGFNMVSLASNHSIDLGVDALKGCVKQWREQKDVVSTGIFDSQEDRDTIRIIEKNNIKVAFLAYTFGINEYGLTQKTANAVKNNPYYIAMLDKDKIKQDVEKAKELSDIIVVGVHWGLEGVYELTDLQKEYAQYFADLGVNVVIGSHPHNIQKTEIIDDTVVVYSLGNFISTMNGVDNQLEGMVSMNFVKQDGHTTVEDLKFIPLINHHNSAADDIAVYPLKDYNKTSEHAILKDQNDIIETFRKKVKSLVSSDFKIEM